MKTPHTVVLMALCALLSPFAAFSQDTAKTVAPRDSVAAGDYDKTFTKVEIESSFPGGSAAWIQFLNTHLVYPNKAVRRKIQGTVILQFIIDKQGNVSDLSAISGDPILAAAALKAMENSPKWIPAEQHGRKVKSYKKQPIVFKLE
jgi:protein TonB